MHRFVKSSRVAALAVATLGISSCFNDDKVLGPELRGANSIFQSYVALGNSITAGWQSSGITDATQRQSFAFLLAQQMGTRFAYPSLAAPGCPPPVINFQTQARPTGTTGSTCALRQSFTDVLNNVGVVNASSYDPTDPDGTPFSNALQTFTLGGKTQVKRALEANPTFVSIWIGNNDVLGFAVQDGRTNSPTGLAGMTSTAQFQTNYNAMLDELVAARPELEGVLIGVVQVSNAPIMFPAAAMSNPTFKAGFDAVAGTPTTLDASCTAGGSGATSLINTFLAFQIRLGAHPPIVACTPGGQTGALPAPVGDILVLHPAELTTITTRINEYNAHIQSRANALGWAYYDPNPTLLTLRAAGTVIRQAPNWAATSADAFGTGMSLDGVHPGASAHRLIANELIAVINTTYGTTLRPVP